MHYGQIRRKDDFQVELKRAIQDWAMYYVQIRRKKNKRMNEGKATRKSQRMPQDPTKLPPEYRSPSSSIPMASSCIVAIHL